VELDGAAIGYAPVSVDSIAPGAHDLRFSGPGLTPWGQALRVRVGEVTELIARPMTTPANGVLEVRATFTDGNGTNVLEGATVWVDGERRGYTPLVLELPRGPHSARVEYRGENAPVEVIDLPGGNQRFATFELGLNIDAPDLQTAPLPSLVPLSRPTVLSASLDNVTSNDVREMWLNVREPDGTWRRYQMVMLKAPDGVVGVAVFPIALFDTRGVARYYVSATTQTGDDYFTEILTARSAPRQKPAAPSSSE
jgi:PEGA domain-containing protein